MDACCHHKGDELAALAKQGRRRVLVLVLAINLGMFVVEFGAGIIARSTALMADSVDMLGDALVYVLSLYAFSRSDRWKAGAALVKGISILVFGGWIALEIVGKLASGVVPTSGLMAIFGTLALAANVLCLALLWRHRGADLNMRSTFECSRNDVIANVGVLLAAAGVWWTAAAWPDIAAGAIVAVLFLRSAVSVIGEAWPALRASPSMRPAAPG
jgi:cation diffusion facilitator family transporter